MSHAPPRSDVEQSLPAPHDEAAFEWTFNYLPRTPEILALIVPPIPDGSAFSDADWPS